MNSMCKLLHSRWTVVLWVEWSVLLLTLYGMYCTAGGQCYCSLNAVCYSEHYVEFWRHETSTTIKLYVISSLIFVLFYVTRA